MKFVFALFTAATALVATVSANPTPQFEDPHFVCAWTLTKWRYCHNAAGCDRDCPAGQACYTELCKTPMGDNSDACTQLKAKCGLEKRLPQFKGEEFFKPSLPHKPIAERGNSPDLVARQSGGDSNAAQVPHVLDIYTERKFTGRYRWTYPWDMLAGVCVDVSDFPVGWSSLKVHPQEMPFHCTFYDLPQCKDGAKSFVIDGTFGYAAADLRIIPGNWDSNIRSLKCQPGPLSKREDTPTDVKRVLPTGGPAQTPPISHLVELFSDPNYTGRYIFSSINEMMVGLCKNVPANLDVSAVKMYAIDFPYWCRIYEKPNCDGEGLVYADLPGEHSYAVPDLKKRWNHRMGSFQCYPGKFQEIPGTERGKRDASVANVFHLVDLFTETNFWGTYTWLYFSAMDGRCTNVNFAISSLKMWDVDTNYWCRIYEKPNCDWSGLGYADLPGEDGYAIPNLSKRGNPNWDNRIKSMQCWHGKFQVIPNAQGVSAQNVTRGE